ncbi:lysine methyltransferase METTL21B [Micractinium conductrix]|uniref:Lysine methyltransferase METTL21B n=1 Tax=Micractinium conductrix TaxID=554055 RepID=A0A2P6V773_9CHLO|nr:lysine methyltransferase METTL21B [Micractinium conductrix]|eukprot:PSC69928.1 lysine methyltransferase METTL21B [Micractinium conductrix]
MSGSPILALPGPAVHWRYDGDFIIAGQPVVVQQEGGQGRGTGWAVWDGAPTLAKYLEAAADDILAGRLPLPAPSSGAASLPPPQSVLELGSGTGLAGLAAAAALRLPTMLTDLAAVLPALERHVAANPRLAALVSAAPLDWRHPHASPALGGSNSCSSAGSSSGGNGAGCQEAGAAVAHPRAAVAHPRLVLAADCLWLEELVGPFVGALAAAASQPGDRALLAYQSRSTRVDGALFGQLSAAGFDLLPAPVVPGEPPRGAIDIYWVLRRPQQQQHCSAT